MALQKKINISIKKSISSGFAMKAFLYDKERMRNEETEDADGTEV